MARRTTRQGELVRLSPLQFSLSISIVVVLMAGAGLAGYYYGLRRASTTAPSGGPAESVREGVAGPEDGAPARGTTVTFYSALTRPRPQEPSASPPEPPPAGRSAAGTATPETPRTEPPGAAVVMLQVASYRDRGMAEKLLHDLSSEGYAGTVVKADLGERGVWFRVRIGPYSSREEAEPVLVRMRETRKLKGFIVN